MAALTQGRTRPTSSGHVDGRRRRDGRRHPRRVPRRCRVGGHRRSIPTSWACARCSTTCAAGSPRTATRSARPSPSPRAAPTCAPTDDPMARMAVVRELDDDAAARRSRARAADYLVVARRRRRACRVIGFCMGGMQTLKAAATGRFDRAVAVLRDDPSCPTTGRGGGVARAARDRGATCARRSRSSVAPTLHARRTTSTRCAPRGRIGPTARSSCTPTPSTASCTRRSVRRTAPTTPPTRGVAPSSGSGCRSLTHVAAGGFTAGTATIMFTDLVGSTEMRTRLGDAAADDVHRNHDRLARRSVDEHGGTLVKRLGDGILATFGAAADAVAAATTTSSARSTAPAGRRRGPRRLAVRIGSAPATSVGGRRLSRYAGCHGGTPVRPRRAAGSILSTTSSRGLARGRTEHSSGSSANSNSRVSPSRSRRTSRVGAAPSAMLRRSRPHCSRMPPSCRSQAATPERVAPAACSGSRRRPTVRASHCISRRTWRRQDPPGRGARTRSPRRRRAGAARPLRRAHLGAVHAVDRGNPTRW